jgi:hypothetical protein
MICNEIWYLVFMIGNPYTTWYSGMPAKLETFWGHQLIDKPTWDAYYATCVTSKTPNPLECAQYYLEMSSMIDLNVYALDYPVCVEDPTAAKGRMQRYWHMDHMLQNYSKELRAAVGLGESKSDYEPCAEDYMEKYLNQAAVKEAIHVKTDVEWQQCSYDILYEMRDSLVSMTPIYNYLIDGCVICCLIFLWVATSMNISYHIISYHIVWFLRVVPC